MLHNHDNNEGQAPLVDLQNENSSSETSRGFLKCNRCFAISKHCFIIGVAIFPIAILSAPIAILSAAVHYFCAKSLTTGNEPTFTVSDCILRRYRDGSVPTVSYFMLQGCQSAYKAVNGRCRHLSINGADIVTQPTESIVDVSIYEQESHHNIDRTSNDKPANCAYMYGSICEQELRHHIDRVSNDKPANYIYM